MSSKAHFIGSFGCSFASRQLKSSFPIATENSVQYGSFKYHITRFTEHLCSWFLNITKSNARNLLAVMPRSEVFVPHQWVLMVAMLIFVVVVVCFSIFICCYIVWPSESFTFWKWVIYMKTQVSCLKLEVFVGAEKGRKSYFRVSQELEIEKYPHFFPWNRWVFKQLYTLHAWKYWPCSTSWEWLILEALRSDLRSLSVVWNSAPTWSSPFFPHYFQLCSFPKLRSLTRLFFHSEVLS